MWSYISYYSPPHYTGAWLQCFCNNQGIISNINSMLTTTTTWPNDATNDDYDVYRAICKTVKSCDTIQITFWHIKAIKIVTPNACSPVSNNLMWNVTSGPNDTPPPHHNQVQLSKTPVSLQWHHTYASVKRSSATMSTPTSDWQCRLLCIRESYKRSTTGYCWILIISTGHPSMLP